jgi:hypothetical protein
MLPSLNGGFAMATHGSISLVHSTGGPPSLRLPPAAPANASIDDLFPNARVIAGPSAKPLEGRVGFLPERIYPNYETNAPFTSAVMQNDMEFVFSTLESRGWSIDEIKALPKGKDLSYQLI